MNFIHQIELREHQEKALKELHDGQILWGRTGIGKSRVAVAYYQKQHNDKDVYVITSAKKRDSKDWQGDFAKIGVGRKWNATVHGVLAVDSWNNIGGYADVKDAFFIFDEQRLVGKGAWVKAFLKIAKNNKWIMLSATPGDTWLDYIPVFIANGFYKNRTQFISEHVVYTPYTKFPKVARYLNVAQLYKNREKLLVHMRWQPETIRHTMIEHVSHNEELLKHIIKNRWHVYQNRPIRDVTELFAVMRQVVNSDPSRMRKIEELLIKHPKMIVFYNFNYELDMLKRLDKITTMAQWNGWVHEPIPTDDSWVYLVQYVAGSEAWNCIETDTTIFYSYTYSYKLWEQAHGRIDRMNTPFIHLYYYTLRSQSIVDNAIWGSLRAKKSFNAGRDGEKLLKAA